MASSKRDYRKYDAVTNIKAIAILILFAAIIAVASPLIASTSADCERDCDTCFITENRASANIPAISVSSFNQCEQTSVVSYNAPEREIKPFLTVSSIEHPPKF